MPLQGLLLDCSVILDGKRYRLSLWLAFTAPVSLARRRFSLNQLPAALPIELPLVVGMAITPAGELLHLQPGDVWWTDGGWWIEHNLRGKGALGGPTADVGASVDVSNQGIVLRNHPAALQGSTGPRGMELQQGMGESRGINMNRDATTTEQDDPLAQTLADLPIEVRVELGSITLAAADWAQLSAGDVIPFGPMPSPLRLRANGKVIAEGELVRVDDGLGVRVTSVSPDRAL
jgi:type III secretion system YscQ/HrcQ family protein